MNAIQVLKEDHRKIKQLFQEFDSAADRSLAQRRSLAETIFKELEMHTRLEEDIFYPAVSRVSKKGKQIVEESLEEHHEVDELIEELRDLDEEDPDYSNKFHELIENVESHIEDEEAEMFPEAQSKLGGELEALGREMEEEKATASAL